ncbi:MAG: sporulation protein YunB [Clostridia bacterium]|nr:sporulation protein YunB [Clostridia bacterium]
MALYYRKRKRKLIAISALLATFFLIIYFIVFKFSPLFYVLSKEKVYAHIFEIINQTIYEQMKEIGDDSLIQYQYNTEGEINAVNANVVVMNKLNNEINTEIIQKLSNLENIYVKVPLGSLAGMNFLSGIGPEIPIKIIPLNTLGTEYRTEFTSAGINQTRHRIYIKVRCEVNVLSNISSDIQNIEIEIPISETILLGNVPSTYFEFGKQTPVNENNT